MSWTATDSPKEGEAVFRRMLSSRSARLAAILLLALLFGWTMRAFRKGETTTIPVSIPAAMTPVNEPPKNTFPDE